MLLNLKKIQFFSIKIPNILQFQKQIFLIKYLKLKKMLIFNKYILIMFIIILMLHHKKMLIL